MSGDWSIGYDPSRVAYVPYRNCRPRGSHPNPAHWNWIRQEVFKRDGFKCRECPARQGDYFPDYGWVRLEAHHRHYENWGNEKLDDLSTLCKECHRGITDRAMYWRNKARTPEFRPADVVLSASTPTASIPRVPLSINQNIGVESCPASQTIPFL